MDSKTIAELRNKLISDSNPGWKHILELQSMVQKDFNDQNYLSALTFREIADWKLQHKKSQVDKITSFSPDELIHSITRCYNEAEHPDDEMNLRVKMHILLSIPWIGIGIGSAIMALQLPHLYGSIDTHSWAVLYGKEKKTFSISDYVKYLNYIRHLAKEADCTVMEIDYLLWKQYDI